MDTSIEIRLRIQEFYLRVIRPYEIEMQRFSNIALRMCLHIVEQNKRDHKIELQRMADDGCPLGD